MGSPPRMPTAPPPPLTCLGASPAASYRAAGVLPYAVLASGEVAVLLGAEVCSGPVCGTFVRRWSDFGGKREAIDNGLSCATAAREFSEETLGLFGGIGVDAASVALSTAAMTSRLAEADARDDILCVESTIAKGGVYCMYVARVVPVDALMFNLATQENKVAKTVLGAEKVAFAWVNANRLLHAIEEQPERRLVSFLAAPACRRKLCLHPAFAVTLRRACKAGLNAFFQRARTSVSKRKSKAGASGRAFLRRFPSQQRPWIANAFYEVVRAGASEPQQVLDSVQAAACGKLTARNICRDAAIDAISAGHMSQEEGSEGYTTVATQSITAPPSTTPTTASGQGVCNSQCTSFPCATHPLGDSSLLRSAEAARVAWELLLAELSAHGAGARAYAAAVLLDGEERGTTGKERRRRKQRQRCE
eukprot:jgi/Chlat1/2633/Chrsp178S02471